MKCIRCGDETMNRKICYRCMNDWTTMRTQVFDILQNKYGKLTQENHPLFIKEMKRLERIWRKDRNEFLKELNKI